MSKRLGRGLKALIPEYSSDEMQLRSRIFFERYGSSEYKTEADVSFTIVSKTPIIPIIFFILTPYYERLVI